MEKKTYIQPAVTVTQLNVENIIALSQRIQIMDDGFDADAEMEVRSERFDGKAGSVEWDSWE